MWILCEKNEFWDKGEGGGFCDKFISQNSDFVFLRIARNKVRFVR